MSAEELLDLVNWDRNMQSNHGWCIPCMGNHTLSKRRESELKCQPLLLPASCMKTQCGQLSHIPAAMVFFPTVIRCTFQLRDRISFLPSSAFVRATRKHTTNFLSVLARLPLYCRSSRKMKTEVRDHTALAPVLGAPACPHIKGSNHTWHKS